MRKFSLIILAFLVLGTTCFPFSKQSIRFETIPAELLPSNEVRKLYQDSEGFIWIPTYSGLARYDGYGTVIYAMTNDKGMTFSNIINIVTEDGSGNLWIGTERGVLRMDKHSGEISAPADSTIAERNVSSLLFDRKYGLWVGTDKGLYLKRLGSDSFEHIALVEQNLKPIEAITSLTRGKGSVLWIASFQCGLIRLNMDNGFFKLYNNDDALRRAHVTATDNVGNLWIGTWGMGLVKLTEPYTDGDASYQLWKNNPEDGNSLLDDIIYDIEASDADGNIYIGSRSGLSVMNSQTREDAFINFIPSDNAGELPYNEVNSIIRSRDGILWLGMLGGGVAKVHTGEKKYKIDPLPSVRGKYNTSSIRSIYYIGNGKYWFGLFDHGLIWYDSNTQECINYKELPDLKHLPYTATVTSIIRRQSTGELCFGTWDDGVWLYDDRTHKVRTLNKNNTRNFYDDCVQALSEDRDGNLLIATRKGLFIEDKSGTFHTVSDWTGNSTPLDSLMIHAVTCDSDGSVWCATNEGKIIQIADRKVVSHTVPDDIHYNQINSILADGNGCIWAGTSKKGLIVKTSTSSGFRSVEEFPSISNGSVQNLIQDGNSRLWICTGSAVYSFFPDKDGHPLNISSYFLSSDSGSFFFNRNAIALIDYGRVAIGGSKGLATFNGVTAQSHQSALPLVFTDLRIHNRPLRSLPAKERFRISEHDIVYSDRLRLTHRQNNFMVEFSTLTFNNSDNNLFRYRLDGFDKEYLTVDSQHRFASYNNLPAGKYTLHLQGAGEAGVWSSNEKTLEIRILPSPWLSIYAMAGYVLITAAIAVIVLSFIRNRLRLRQEIQLSKIEKAKNDELNHAKLEFYTNVTHDLMTPLSIIMASLDSMKHKSGDSAALISIMSGNATRLMRLIQQILEFRKVESGNLRIRVSNGNLTEFVRKCANAFIPLTGKKKLKLYFNGTDTDESCWFDTDKVDKIIYNLLSNATKYTPDGGEINLNVRISDNIATISVSNTGELMDSETLKALFRRFYDGEYRKYHTMGTGIGLSLVKDLVEIHKGRIEVRSNPEENNIFIVSLPVGIESWSEDEREDATEIPEMGPDEEISSEEVQEVESDDRSILVVDDNEELLLLLSSLLSQHYKVETASNGEEAIDELQKNKYALVVSDIMMPVMDGFELCRRIKSSEEWKGIPVLLLTARNAEESKIEGYDSGADGYVTKPFNLNVLLARIRNLLRKSDSSGEKARPGLVFEIETLDYTSEDEDFMTKAMNFINIHLDDGNFSQGDFADLMCMSRTVLTERLKKLTGLTPSAFIVDVRLRAAKQLLEDQPAIRIKDLAYASGFNDAKYFSTCFRKKFGYTPKDFINSIKEKGEKLA